MPAEPTWARRVLLIANPRAGAGDRSRVDEVIARCERLVPRVDVVRTTRRGHAQECAAGASTADVDAVVVLGGDGTAGEVASGLARPNPARPAGRAPAMLNLPFGTGNSFFREIWADAPWSEVLERALTGGRPRLRRVDMAHVRETGAWALLGAGAGLVAEVLVAARDLLDVQGRDRYRLAVERTMRTYVPYEGRVSVDGAVVHEGPVTFVNIGGGRHRAGRFELLPHSVVDDGLLDVCVVGGQTDVRELAGLTRDGSHVGRPGVVYERGSRIVVERLDGRPLSFEHDGELGAEGLARYSVEVLPGVLPVLAPIGRE
ncbi:diacylglycerol/lipid kinase family protein (plasmid) [Streptomyces sp. BI20]|uniref:diacylglycerol/lipid kinase family protein n=1 Tax=Streptomyces sp. BI20 TaxID=3403460 RepID=UPI003C73AEE4